MHKLFIDSPNMEVHNGEEIVNTYNTDKDEAASPIYSNYIDYCTIRGITVAEPKISEEFMLDNDKRPSQNLCKPPKWCRIEAPYWRFIYEQ